MLGIAAVLAIVIALVGPSGGDADEPSTASAVIKLVLGVAATLLGVRQWQTRPREGEEPALPAWMKAVDTMTPTKAAGLGLLLSAVNPKNLTLCLAGGATIGGAGLSLGQNVTAAAVFVVLASVSIGAPVLGYLVAAERLRDPLNELRGWLTVHNAAVMTILLLVIGVTLVGKGIAGL